MLLFAGRSLPPPPPPPGAPPVVLDKCEKEILILGSLSNSLTREWIPLWACDEALVGIIGNPRWLRWSAVGRGRGFATGAPEPLIVVDDNALPVAEPIERAEVATENVGDASPALWDDDSVAMDMLGLLPWAAADCDESLGVPNLAWKV